MQTNYSNRTFITMIQLKCIWITIDIRYAIMDLVNFKELNIQNLSAAEGMPPAIAH